MSVRVVLPYGLQTLAHCGAEVTLDVPEPVTQQNVLSALEQRYPQLSGAVIDHATGKRRPMVRFFACKEDVSHLPPDSPLPDPVVRGEEPFIIVGAIAGG